MNLRWIVGIDSTDADWDRIEGILASRGWMSLNRSLSRILVAEDEDKNLLGFIVLQMVPHTEPLWVAPKERGTGLAEQLADRMVEYLTEMKVRGFMVMADSPFAAEMCEKHKMERVKSPVYIAK